MTKRNYSKLLMLCASISLIISACQPREKFDGYTINGTVKGLDVEWVKMVKPNKIDFTKNQVIDSARVVDGAFEFKGKIEHADIVFLSIGDNKYNFGPDLFLENSAITVELSNVSINEKIDLKLTKVSGSKLHDLYQAQLDKSESIWNKEEYALMREIKAEQLRVSRLDKNHPDRKAVYNKFMENLDLRNALVKERNDAKLKFVKENPESPVAAAMLLFVYSPDALSKEEMKEYFALLRGAAKHTQSYAALADRYRVLFESFSPGAILPDFTLPSVDGGELTLSEVEGKYILVDFWASWCGPCRALFPHVKKLYKKYNKDGFEVVAIGTGDIKAKWKKAIEEDQTKWNNLFDTNGTDKGVSGGLGIVAKSYGVTALPTTYIVDKNLTIMAKTRGEKELNDKLKELFGY